MTKVSFGKYGEGLASKFLQRKGYQIIERNFRIRGGEIDIVAIDGETLVYVEVKTRTSRKFGRPEEAVTIHKLNFLKRAAKFYRNNRRNLPSLERIDVVTVDLIDFNHPVFKLFKNASL